MASITLLRDDLESGTLNGAITDVATTVTFAAAPGWATLNAGNAADQYRVIRIEDELIHVTAYTAAALTATISRGAEGTAAAAHADGTAWEEPPTAGHLAPEIGHLGPTYPKAVGAGTWAFNAVGYIENTTAAQNDEASWSVLLQAGTYRFDFEMHNDTDAGIVTPTLADGLLFSTDLSGSADTFDSYAASGARAFHSLTGVVVPTSGMWELKVDVAAKNASSSAFAAKLYGVGWTRTA